MPRRKTKLYGGPKINRNHLTLGVVTLVLTTLAIMMMIKSVNCDVVREARMMSGETTVNVEPVMVEADIAPVETETADADLVETEVTDADLVETEMTTESLETEVTSNIDETEATDEEVNYDEADASEVEFLDEATASSLSLTSPVLTTSEQLLFETEQTMLEAEQLSFETEPMASTSIASEIEQASGEVTQETIDESGVAPYTESELLLLAQLIYAEGGCEWFPDWVQINIGSVVLNRLSSPEYPDTLYEVIFQKGQYGPTVDGRINNHPDARTMANARWLLENGSQLPAGVLGQRGEPLGPVHSVYYDAVLDASIYFFYV